MQQSFFDRHRSIRIGCAAVIAVLGSAWLVRAQVGSTGIIFGCLSPSGFIRGIDETTGTCRTSDVPLAWYTKVGADATFLGKTGKGLDADTLDGLDSTAFLLANGIAADAAKLGGLAPASYLRATDTAVNSAQLGGLPPTAFAQFDANGDLAVPHAITFAETERAYAISTREWVAESDAHDNALGVGFNTDPYNRSMGMLFIDKGLTETGVTQVQRFGVGIHLPDGAHLKSLAINVFRGQVGASASLLLAKEDETGNQTSLGNTTVDDVLGGGMGAAVMSIDNLSEVVDNRHFSYYATIVAFQDKGQAGPGIEIRRGFATYTITQPLP